MSLVLFLDRLNKSRLHPNDIKWMPAWFTQFATGRPVVDEGRIGELGTHPFWDWVVVF
ncbi:MAG: hypothetical protein NTY15_14885 [Planctomycetota bacterium]|nr:hypothetical protein [Planctomycetota bacterium]